MLQDPMWSVSLLKLVIIECVHSLCAKSTLISAMYFDSLCHLAHKNETSVMSLPFGTRKSWQIAKCAAVQNIVFSYYETIKANKIVTCKLIYLNYHCNTDSMLINWCTSQKKVKVSLWFYYCRSEIYKFHLKGTVPAHSGTRINRLTQGPQMSSRKHFR